MIDKSEKFCDVPGLKVWRQTNLPVYRAYLSLPFT